MEVMLILFNFCDEVTPSKNTLLESSTYNCYIFSGELSAGCSGWGYFYKK